jgi:hypothetical protein
MGFQPLISVVNELPLGDIFFRDLRWIGVAMLLVLAVPNLTAAIMLFRRSEHQYRATFASAVLLMLWCGFELIFMLNVGAVGYFLAGALAAFCSGALLRTADQERVSQARRARTR